MIEFITSYFAAAVNWFLQTKPLIVIGQVSSLAQDDLPFALQVAQEWSEVFRRRASAILLTPILSLKNIPTLAEKVQLVPVLVSTRGKGNSLRTLAPDINLPAVVKIRPRRGVVLIQGFHWADASIALRFVRSLKYLGYEVIYVLEKSSASPGEPNWAVLKSADMTLMGHDGAVQQANTTDIDTAMQRFRDRGVNALCIDEADQLILVSDGAITPVGVRICGRQSMFRLCNDLVVLTSSFAWAKSKRRSNLTAARNAAVRIGAARWTVREERALVEKVIKR